MFFWKLVKNLFIMHIWCMYINVYIINQLCLFATKKWPHLNTKAYWKNKEMSASRILNEFVSSVVRIKQPIFRINGLQPSLLFTWEKFIQAKWKITNPPNKIPAKIKNDWITVLLPHNLYPNCVITFDHVTMLLEGCCDHFSIFQSSKLSRKK